MGYAEDQLVFVVVDADRVRLHFDINRSVWVMKLKTKSKYFKQIRSGKKLVDYRDAHITFINEETGQKCVRDVVGVRLITRDNLPSELYDSVLFDDNKIIAFELSEETRK